MVDLFAGAGGVVVGDLTADLGDLAEVPDLVFGAVAVAGLDRVAVRLPDFAAGAGALLALAVLGVLRVDFMAFSGDAARPPG